MKVVLIGGSAGSLEVLMKVAPILTVNPVMALVIILHRKASEDSTLEDLFRAKTSIPVQEIEDKTLLAPGYMYIAPANYHLLFENDHHISLDVSEKVNYSRPSIDVAFESAAEIYGSQLTAILLSGSNADGTAGLLAVRDSGGTTVVQDPDTAEMPFMPKHAIDTLTIDHVLDVEALADFIQNTI